MTEDVKKLDVDEIQKIVMERICFSEYAPGRILKESLLAKEFGVSRTPLREALNRLHYFGLIETRNGVGTVVVEISPEKLAQIYEMRLELASLIGKLSPNILGETEEQVGRDLLHRAKALTVQFDPVQYVYINHELNSLIYEIIGNDSLKGMWQQLYYQAASHWYRVVLDSPDEAVEALVAELEDLCFALKMKDAEAVGLGQRIHISYGYKRIKAHSGW